MSLRLIVAAASRRYVSQALMLLCVSWLMMGNVDVARYSFLKISQSESALLVVGEAGTGMIIFPVRRFGQTFAFFPFLFAYQGATDELEGAEQLFVLQSSR